MNVLHLVGGDLNAGAGRGAFWLHHGLRAIGIESRILTNSAYYPNNERVIYITRSRMEKVQNLMRAQLDALPVRFYGRGNEIFFSTGMSGYDFTRTAEYREADIIHLHWINRGFVNIKHLAKVNKPLIWTMRDMWPMTGGCHYDIECENFKQGCGKCPQLKSTSALDLSRWVWRRKKRYLPRSTKIIGISHWLTEQAKKSALLKEYDVRTIPNNVNTHDFFPISKETARDILGIRTNKKIILAGAQGLKWFYKGFDKLLESFVKLEKNRYYLIFMGSLEEDCVKSLGFEYKQFGFLHDTISMRLVYSAADVFVAPSIVEAFGKTIVEAMACGTPAVCFDATGPKDIVDHLMNGYKASPFETEDLARGIQWVASSERHSDLCNKARDKAVTAFDSSIIAGEYKKLYEEMLESR